MKALIQQWLSDKKRGFKQPHTQWKDCVKTENTALKNQGEWSYEKSQSC